MFSVALPARRHLKQRARESRLRVKGEERKEISLEQSQGFFFSNYSLVCRQTGTWPYKWPGLKTPGPSHQCLRWLSHSRADDRRNGPLAPDWQEEAQLPYKGYRNSAGVAVGWDYVFFWNSRWGLLHLSRYCYLKR